MVHVRVDEDGKRESALELGFVERTEDGLCDSLEDGDILLIFSELSNYDIKELLDGSLVNLSVADNLVGEDFK